MFCPLSEKNGNLFWLHCLIRNFWKFAKNGRKKSSKSFSDLLLHVLLRGGGIFSFYVIGQAGTWTGFQSALFWCSPPYQNYNSRSFWRNSGYTRHIGQGQLVSLWGRPHVLLLSCHRGEVGYSWDSTSISSFSRFKASWICRPIVLRVQPLCSPISFCVKCWR